MNNKRIALDINDVLRDNLGQWISIYKEFVDGDFDIDANEIKTNDMSKILPFRSKEEFERFNYMEYAYELYGRAAPKLKPTKIVNWLQIDLREFEQGKMPEVILVSPMEMGVTIQSTLSFLVAVASRFREIYFPMDSATIWDRCDILITANPKFLKNIPNDKTVIKIEMPYNKDIECEHAFSSLEEMIDSRFINKLLSQMDENENNGQIHN